MPHFIVKNIFIRINTKLFMKVKNTTMRFQGLLKVYQQNVALPI